MKKLKVAIVGGNSKTDPKLDGSWEIWNVNGIVPWWVPESGFARSFHLHRYADLKRDIPNHVKNYETWCYMNSDVKVYLIEPWKKITRAEIFPRNILRRMPRGDYHCGSFDWLTAFAVHLGAKEISLHGIGLHRESGEPISSGPCLEYWCGFAEGRGVRVTTDKDCDLFFNYHMVKSHLVYGYDSWDLVEDRTK